MKVCEVGACYVTPDLSYDIERELEKCEDNMCGMKQKVKQDIRYSSCH